MGINKNIAFCQKAEHTQTKKMTSLVLQNPNDFKHILRMQNTNLDGKQKAPFGLRQIKGIGRRFAILTMRIADINLEKRTGELTEDETKDPRDGGFSQLISNQMDTIMREDLERMRKAKQHRGLRHFWGHRVRGQRTKSTGRCGKTLGVQRKK